LDHSRQHVLPTRQHVRFSLIQNPNQKSKSFLYFRDLLLNRLHDAAMTGGVRAEAAYLDALQPLILNEQLHAPPPALLQRLVNHLEVSGNLQALEACLVRVDVGCLDVHQAMKLCWQHNLYDAIIYVHTSGMQDFETPFTELATVLQNALATGTYVCYQKILVVMIKYSKGQN
jgi:vacuolar protein sorting-associated protein 8